jgi:hypothetical protein
MNEIGGRFDAGDARATPVAPAGGEAPAPPER